MSLEEPVIAIVGSGAVGSYYGGRLAQHGHDVHFLFRSDYQMVRRDGLRVKSPDGDFAIAADALRAYDRPEAMPKADLVLIALKATANHVYQPLIRPMIKDDTILLTVQNGLGNERQLAALFGTERVMGGLAFVCLNRMPDGVILHLDHGLLQIGEFIGGATPRLRRVAEMFNLSGVQCQPIDNLSYGRWEKLVWNIPFNGLGAVMDTPTDILIGTEAGLTLVTGLMAEVIEAAAAAGGIHFPPDMIERKINHTKSMGAYRTSMQIDRQEGRELEIEAILGEPLRAADSAGVRTPSLRMLYHLARLAKDSDRNKPRSR
jgi:2-dehydropantoate 2-reductase